MPCRTAYLIHEPTITEVNEQQVSYYSRETKRWETYTQPFIVPEYRVWLTYDYGFCCGVDFSDVPCATREDAQALIDKIYRNEHEWIKYDPEYMEEDDD